METVQTQQCDKHKVELENGTVCELCVLESLSRQNREYAKKYFPGVMVPPPVEFHSIQEIMSR
jgi:hypothetical protein